MSDKEVTFNREDIVIAADELCQMWPLIPEQIFYRLAKNNKIPNNGESFDDFLTEAYHHVISDRIGPEVFIGKQEDFHESFLHYESIEERKASFRNQILNHVLSIPQFVIWHGQPKHVEVWVEGSDIANFLRAHIRKDLPVEICEANHILEPGICEKTWARLDFIREVEEKQCIALYLGELSDWGMDLFGDIQERYEYRVERFDRLGVNREHLDRLLISPCYVFEDEDGDELDKEYMEHSKQFMRELDLKGFYSLYSFEPSELVALVDNAIGRYYDMDKMPSEQLFKWNETLADARKYLGKMFNDILALKDDEF